MPVKNLGRLTQLNMHVNNFTDFPNQLPRALRVLILEQNKIRSIKRRSLGRDINKTIFRFIGYFGPEEFQKTVKMLTIILSNVT